MLNCWVLSVLIICSTLADEGKRTELPSDTTKVNLPTDLPNDSTVQRNVDDVKEKQMLLIYQRLFKQQRKAHKDGIDALVNLNYERQYKMITIGLEKLFKVLSESKLMLVKFGYTPGDPIPVNETIRDALSNVAENTAFFGDLVLRLPDMTHRIYDKNKEWQILIGWSVGFCNSSNILTGKDLTVLNLMAQELNFIEKDPNYINPYKEENIKKSKRSVEEKTTANIKKKKLMKKGPRMSRTDL